MDMSFLYSYKPVLYPLIPSDYDRHYSDDADSEQHSVRSLVNTCCRKIVEDAAMTNHARQNVPTDLCEPLLVAALQLDRDRAIEQLVASWPRLVLSLSRFSPAMFAPRVNGLLSPSASMPYCSDLELCEHMRRGVKQTTCLAHTFIECLKRHSDTKLRCLDLSGYPSAEVIVNYLASHVLLVYNETRQKEIIQVYDAVTRELPVDQRRHFTLNSTIPDDHYIITVDAIIQSEDAHMELCRALRVSKMTNAKLRLRLGKLDISCLGVPRIVVLLEQLEKEYLTGVSLQYNAITAEGLHVLCPVLQSFSHLTALDLAYNGIVISQSLLGLSTINVMSEALAALPLLSRLNLSGIRMSDCITSVLGLVTRPLLALRLSGCGLRPNDFIWLSTSVVTSRLEELDIGANNLTISIMSVLVLLNHSAETLAILEAEEASLNSASVLALFVAFSRLGQLRYINITGNSEIGASAVIDSLELLVNVQKLRAIRLTIPSDVVVPQGIAEDLSETDHARRLQEVRTDFAKRIGDLMSRLCMIHLRSNVKFIFRL